MDLGLKGKVAIVTGGARGIGKGCSTALAMEGCNLAIVDLGHDETTRAYMEELKKEYEVDVLELAADVSNEEQIQQVYKDTLEHYGKIDILINNAGKRRYQKTVPRAYDGRLEICSGNYIKQSVFYEPGICKILQRK